MKWSLIPLLLSLVLNMWAQQSRRVVEFEIPLSSSGWVSAKLPIGLEAPSPFVAYSARWQGELSEPLQIRFSADGREWTPWLSMPRDPHNTEAQVSELQFADKNQAFYQLSGTTYDETVALSLHFFNPGDTPAHSVEPVEPGPQDLLAACPCPMPPVIGRQQWCPAGNCPPNASPSTTQVTHLIVHHSAGVNTSSDWAAVVRSIWDFHVNTNGWADIGYNWLVDPDGKLYTGRGDNILGAHFCAHNGGTMGVCMMGNFTSITPTQNAINILVELLAWKACDRNIDPLGQAFHNSSGFVVPNVGGHRDGCATACPGDSFYPLLAGVRQQVFSRIVAGCSGLPGPTQLSVSPLTATDYSLSWTDNSTTETGFLLERALGTSGAFQLLANLPANTTSHPEMGLSLGEVYRYRVRSYTAMDTSAYSNVVQIGPLTGIREPWAAASLQLSPNPASEVLQIQWSEESMGPLDIQVLDLQQRLYRQESHRKTTTNWQHSLPVAELPAGTYLLRLQMNERVGYWKWIKS